MEHDFLQIKIVVVEGCRLGFCGKVSVQTGTDIPAYNTTTHYHSEAIECLAGIVSVGIVTTERVSLKIR